MRNIDYCKVYESLGISVEPLPVSYNPEEYGKMLMSQFSHTQGVSYSASTVVIDLTSTPPDSER